MGESHTPPAPISMPRATETPHNMTWTFNNIIITWDPSDVWDNLFFNLSFFPFYHALCIHVQYKEGFALGDVQVSTDTDIRYLYVPLYQQKNLKSRTHQTTDISCVHGDNKVVLSEISPLKLTFVAGYPVHSSDTDILKVMMMIMMALLMSHAWSRSWWSLRMVTLAHCAHRPWSGCADARCSLSLQAQWGAGPLSASRHVLQRYI